MDERNKFCLEHSRRMDDHDRRLTVLDGAVDHLKRAVYGNIETIGVLARIKRVEELISEQKRVRGWLLAAVVTAVLNLAALLLMWALGS